MADNEITLDRQELAEVAKPSAKPKKETEVAHPPLLIEFMVTLSVIFLVVVFFTIIGISLVTGASLLDLVLRTSISILVIGGFLVVIVRQIYVGMLTTGVVVEEKSEQKQSDDNAAGAMPSPSEVK